MATIEEINFKLGADVQEFRQNMGVAKKIVKETGDSIKQGFDEVDEASQKASKSIKETSEEMKELDKSSKSSGSAMGTLAKVVAGSAAVALGALAIKMGAVRGTVDLVVIGLATLTGHLGTLVKGTIGAAILGMSAFASQFGVVGKAIALAGVGITGLSGLLGSFIKVTLVSVIAGLGAFALKMGSLSGAFKAFGASISGFVSKIIPSLLTGFSSLSTIFPKLTSFIVGSLSSLALFGARVEKIIFGIQGVFGKTLTRLALGLEGIGVAAGAAGAGLGVFDGVLGNIGDAFNKVSLAAFGTVTVLGFLVRLAGGFIQNIGLKMISVTNSWAEVAQKQQKNLAVVNTTLSSYIERTGDASLSLEKMASEIARVSAETGISRTEISQAVAQNLELGRVTGLTSQQIVTLIEEVGKLSTFLGFNFLNSVQIIDNALRGMDQGAISSLGINIDKNTEQWNKWTKALGFTEQKLNDAQEAAVTFAVILETIQENTKGVSDEANNLAFILKSQIAGNLETLRANLGKAVNESMIPFLRAARDLSSVLAQLPEGFTAFIGQLLNIGGIFTTVSGIVLKFGGTLIALVGGLGLLNAGLARIALTGFGTFLTGLLGVSAAALNLRTLITRGLILSISTLGQALVASTVILLKYGLRLGALAVVGLAAGSALRDLNRDTGVVTKSLNFAQSVIDGTRKNLNELSGGADLLSGTFKTLAKGIQAAFVVVGVVITSVVVLIAKAIQEIARLIEGTVVAKASKFLADLPPFITQAIPGVGALAQAFGQLGDNIAKGGETAKSVEKSAKDMQESFKKSFEQIKVDFADIFRGIERVGEISEKTGEKSGKALAVIPRELREQIDKLVTGSAEEQLRALNLLEKQITEFRDKNKGLISDEDLRKLNIALSEIQKDRKRLLDAGIKDAEKHKDELLRLEKELTKGTLSEFNKKKFEILTSFEDEITKIDKLRQDGIIGEQQAAQLRLQANQKMHAELSALEQERAEEIRKVIDDIAKEVEEARERLQKDAESIIDALLPASERIAKEARARLIVLKDALDEHLIAQEEFERAKLALIKESEEEITKALRQEEIVRLRDEGGLFNSLKAGFLEFIDSVQNSSELMSQFFANTLSEMSSNFSVLFFNVIKGKFDDLADVAKAAFDAILKSFLDLITAIATREIVIRIAGLFGLGGSRGTQQVLGAVGGSSDFLGSLGSAVGGVGSLLGSAGSFFGGGTAATFGTELAIGGGIPVAIPGSSLAGGAAGALGAVGTALGVIGAVAAVAAIAIPLISGLFKTKPRLDIDIPRAKALAKLKIDATVETYLAFDDLNEKAQQALIGISAKGGVEDSVKGKVLRKQIADIIKTTIEGIQDIINRLPSDIADELNEALLKTEIDPVEHRNALKILELDIRSGIEKKLKPFIEGIPGSFSIAIRDFFKKAFVTLGTGVEEAQAIIDDFLARFLAIKGQSPEAIAERAAIGQELLVTFGAFVDAFNFINDNFDNELSRFKAGIESVSEKLGFETVPSIQNLKDALEEMIRVGNISAETVADILALANAIQQFQQVVVDATLDIISGILTTISNLQRLDAQVVRFGGQSLGSDLDSSIAGGLSASVTAIQDLFTLEPELSIDQRRRALDLFSGVVDAMIEIEIAAVRAPIEAQIRALEAQANALTSQIKTLEAQENALRAQEDALRKEQNAIRKQIEQNNKLISGFRDQISDLNEERRLIQDIGRERLDALNEELRLAEDFERAIDRIDRRVEELTLVSGISPLSVRQRIGLLRGEIETNLSELQTLPVEERAEAISVIEGQLNDLLGLAQEAERQGVGFQRPSGEFQELLNFVLASFQELKTVAIESSRSTDQILSDIESVTITMEADLQRIETSINRLEATIEVIQSRNEQLQEQSDAIQSRIEILSEQRNVISERSRALQEQQRALQDRANELANQEIRLSGEINERIRQLLEWQRNQEFKLLQDQVTALAQIGSDSDILRSINEWTSRDQHWNFISMSHLNSIVGLTARTNSLLERAVGGSAGTTGTYNIFGTPLQLQHGGVIKEFGVGQIARTGELFTVGESGAEIVLPLDDFRSMISRVVSAASSRSNNEDDRDRDIIIEKLEILPNTQQNVAFSGNVDRDINREDIRRIIREVIEDFFRSGRGRDLVLTEIGTKIREALHKRIS